MPGGGDPVRGPGNLTGRTSECALLDDLLDALRAGESRTLLIHGEAGIGRHERVPELLGLSPHLIATARVRGGSLTGAAGRRDARRRRRRQR